MAQTDGSSSSPGSLTRVGKVSPCLMVYPLPSIADETFLHAVFRHKVGRTIFAGFGKGRFAIVELTDKAMLDSIVKLIEARDAAAATLASAAAVPLELQAPLVESAVAATSAEPVEEKLSSWLHDIKAEELTLADLFSRPDGTGADDPGTASRRKGRIGTDSTLASRAHANSTSVDHLLNLSWRGIYPLFVVVSPVTVDDFYTCGGIVPAKKSEGRPPRAAGVKDSAAQGPPSKAAEPAVPAEVPTYSKDCCQKCGSRDHFTRKCDGSGLNKATVAGVVVTEASADATPRTVKRPRAEEQHAAMHAAAPASARVVTSFPKDCCQKCGSRDHFTRKCDSSGPSRSPAAPAAAEAATAVPAPPAVEKKVNNVGTPVKQGAPAPEGAAAPTVARSPFVRSSKDQCKFCGSESHLSRHCPNK